jgi:hypothetical protein
LNAWYVDPSLTTFVVIDLGRPIGYSTGWSYRADGTRYVKWTPVTFHDGAAVVHLPVDVNIRDVSLTVLPQATDRWPITGADQAPGVSVP